MSFTLIRRIISPLLLSLFCLSLIAQEFKYEIGGVLGGSYYTGELNRVPFNNIQPAFGLLFRYNYNTRWALRTTVNWSQSKGHSGDIKNALPTDQRLVFRRSYWNISGLLEFNFLPYGNEFYNVNSGRFTPYLVAGGGYTTGNFAGGTLIAGVGLKYRIKHRINLGGEFLYCYLFSDAFDVSDSTNEMLNDPYKLNTRAWKNKDRFSLFVLTVTWDFSVRNPFCK